MGRGRRSRKAASSLLHEGQQLRPLLHEIAGLEEDALDLAVHGGGDAVFHLHGFQHHQGGAPLHVVARFDGDLDDLAAPLPGKVIQVAVKPGDDVKRGMGAARWPGAASTCALAARGSTSSNWAVASAVKTVSWAPTRATVPVAWRPSMSTRTSP